MASFAAQQPGAPRSNVQTNGQAVNPASLLSGLTRESQVNANTGTATGDRAVQDYAKGMLYANRAALGRSSATQNAKTNMERMSQGEQMNQAWSQAQMNRFKSMSQQKSQQSSLAQSLLAQQIGLNSQWQTSVLGMMR
jgi:hypothetical protein